MAKALTTSNQRIDAETETLIPTRRGGFFSDVAHTLRAEGFDASEDGTGRGTPLVPIVFNHQAAGNQTELGANTVTAATLSTTTTQAVAFALRGREGGALPEIEGDGSNVGALRSASGGSSRDYIAGVGVRRLTPMECERLQSWPDQWTSERMEMKRDGNLWIPTGKVVPQADGPRYKQAGNGVTSNASEWIAKRIAKFLS